MKVGAIYRTIKTEQPFKSTSEPIKIINKTCQIYEKIIKV